MEWKMGGWGLLLAPDFVPAAAGKSVGRDKKKAGLLARTNAPLTLF